MKTIIKLSEKRTVEYEIKQTEFGYHVKCYLLEGLSVVKEMTFFFDEKPMKVDIVGKILEGIKHVG